MAELEPLGLSVGGSNLKHRKPRNDVAFVGVAPAPADLLVARLGSSSETPSAFRTERNKRDHVVVSSFLRNSGLRQAWQPAAISRLRPGPTQPVSRRSACLCLPLG